MYEKIVIVTRKTRYEELIERFNTAGQAKFYIEHAGGDFGEYLNEHDVYLRAIDTLRKQTDIGLKLQSVDRSLVPTFTFTEKDIVIAVGQDGLVANTAKYIGSQPLIGVNPDPARNDGVLLPFLPEKTRPALAAVIENRAKIRATTLAEVALNDGQKLLAFNDFFLGARTHVSARYKITMAKKTEAHSSSGVLVSTGAGSTGWMSSVFNMAAGVSAFSGGKAGARPSLKPDDARLVFVVREPFISRHSQAGIVAGMIESGSELQVESLMPSGGTIFSDGIENDFLEFNAGAIAHIRKAPRTAQLVLG
jgi:NAD kinase